MSKRIRLLKRDFLFLLIGVVVGLLAMVLFAHFSNRRGELLHVSGDTIRYSDGSTYYGVVDELLVPNGYGVKVTHDNIRYAGMWSDGRLASGTMIKGDSIYRGEFRNLQPDGFGRLELPDSDIFIGRWIKGHKSGVGRRTVKGGRVEFGQWNADTLERINPFTIGDLVYGIDISRFQHSIDWTNLYLRADSLGRVAKNGWEKGIESKYFTNKTLNYYQPVQFVIMKSTDGAYRIDPFYYRNVKSARSNNLIVGVYHFLRYEPVEEQIDNFIANVDMVRGDLPPVLDIEDDNRDHALTTHTEEYVAMALRWLQTIEQHYGVRPMIYMSKNTFLKYADGTGLEKYNKWIANYNKSAEQPDIEDWWFWQFSCTGSVGGIQYKDKSHVDMDVFNGNIYQLKEFIDNSWE